MTLIRIDPAEMAEAASLLTTASERTSSTAHGLGSCCCCPMPPTTARLASAELDFVRAELARIGASLAELGIDVGSRGRLAASDNLTTVSTAAFGVTTVGGASAAVVISPVYASAGSAVGLAASGSGYVGGTSVAGGQTWAPAAPVSVTSPQVAATSFAGEIRTATDPGVTIITPPGYTTQYYPTNPETVVPMPGEMPGVLRPIPFGVAGRPGVNDQFSVIRTGDYGHAFDPAAGHVGGLAGTS